jgi:drug/metabolite transporter (DMT)-like permease
MDAAAIWRHAAIFTRRQSVSKAGLNTMKGSFQNHQAAIGALVLACSLWGMTFMFGKIAFAELTVSQVVLYRFSVAAMALLPFALRRGIRVQVRDIPHFLLAGFLTVPLTFMLQFGGLALTSAARASLIVGGLPPMLALAAALFQRERLSVRGWVAVIASTVGVFLIVGLPEPGANWVGDGLIFLSLITTVAWVLLNKRLSQKYTGLTATTLILAVGALSLLPVSLLWDGPPHAGVSGGVWLSVLVMGLLCTALTFTLWNWALQWVSAARAGVFVNLEPVVGVALGVLVFHDVLGATTLLGGLLVLLAAWVVSLPEKLSVQGGRNRNTLLYRGVSWLGRRLIVLGRRLQQYATPLTG